jgi:hypothetical protein
MKFKIFILLLSVFYSLSSLTLIDGKKKYVIDLDKLETYPQTEKSTHREKDNKVKDEIWTGADLFNILQEFNISDYDQLRFTSEDNYQVRLTKQDIEEYKPIIALKRNGEKLSEDKIRLIVPQIRDMFWIQGIIEISTEKHNEMPVPYYLFIAESILANLPLISDPAPFKEVQGYFFIDLVDKIFPELKGEFLLAGADGVSHKLDFDTYLKNAVLIRTENGYNLQSPDMPGGMWIKNLAYIQIFDRAVFFRNQFSAWHDLTKLLGWKKNPQFLNDQNGNPIDVSKEFSDLSWQEIEKVTWQK